MSAATSCDSVRTSGGWGVAGVEGGPGDESDVGLVAGVGGHEDVGARPSTSIDTGSAEGDERGVSKPGGSTSRGAGAG